MPTPDTRYSQAELIAIASSASNPIVVANALAQAVRAWQLQSPPTELNGPLVVALFDQLRHLLTYRADLGLDDPVAAFAKIYA